MESSHREILKYAAEHRSTLKKIKIFTPVLVLHSKQVHLQNGSFVASLLKDKRTEYFVEPCREFLMRNDLQSRTSFHQGSRHLLK